MSGFVILDRDGVINEDSPDYIKSPEEWRPIDGSMEAIALLTSHQIQVFVATNQAGIARGKLTEESLLAIHQKMMREVESSGGVIVDLRYCPHHPSANCVCRKPKPGMLMDLAESYALTLSEGDYVGDSLKDLRAAEAAKCRGVLVLTGNGEETHHLRPNHEPVFENLLAYARQKVSSTN